MDDDLFSSDDMFSDDLTCDSENSGSGFYLSEVDAMAHGAMFQMGDDDGGPGFYL